MSSFNTGDKVTHPMFGAGTVADVSGSGPEAKLTVDFASSIGRKKLIAGFAKLSLAGEGGDGNDTQNAAFVESFDASGKPRRGRWLDPIKLRESVLWEAVKPQFWIALRERLRTKGLAPKVLDEPDGCISISASGLFSLRIRVRHETLKDAQGAACATAIFELLNETVLRDIEYFSTKADAGIGAQLIEADRVFIQEEKVEELPERTPLMRPKKVTPKGVIKSIPKRRDDY